MLRGRMPELTTLAAGFPQDVAAEDPRLVLVQAIAATFANDPERAEDAARRRASRFTSQVRTSSLGGSRPSRSYVTTIIARYTAIMAEVLSALDPAGPNVPGPDDSGFDRSDLDLRAAWRSTRAVSLMWVDQREPALAEARLACHDVRAGAAEWPMVAGLGVQAWLSALDGHLVAADGCSRS